jgi:carbonic anhydrase
MDYVQEMFEDNQRWAEGISSADPEFFQRLNEGQNPEFFWIGCSDSRVPASSLMGALPGEVFVHRNIANLVDEHDESVMCALTFAVDHLKVPHVILCGHTNCGGLTAALTGKVKGRLSDWLEPARDIIRWHADELGRIADDRQRADRLSVLNIAHQVRHLCHTDIVTLAWERGQALTVHGILFDLASGRLKDLNLNVAGPDHPILADGVVIEEQV